MVSLCDMCVVLWFGKDKISPPLTLGTAIFYLLACGNVGGMVAVTPWELDHVINSGRTDVRIVPGRSLGQVI